MIESLRTTQIAFSRFATPCGFFRGAETRYKKYPCKGPCKRKSYETICENVVSWYQTLVFSLPWMTAFDTNDRKPNLWLGRTGSPVISHTRFERYTNYYIFTLDPQKHLECQVQKCGRVGQDDERSKRVLLHNGLMAAHCSFDVKNYIEYVKECRIK